MAVIGSEGTLESLSELLVRLRIAIPTVSILNVGVSTRAILPVVDRLGVHHRRFFPVSLHSRQERSWLFMAKWLLHHRKPPIVAKDICVSASAIGLVDTAMLLDHLVLGDALGGAEVVTSPAAEAQS